MAEACPDSGKEVSIPLLASTSHPCSFFNPLSGKSLAFYCLSEGKRKQQHLQLPRKCNASKIVRRHCICSILLLEAIGSFHARCLLEGRKNGEPSTAMGLVHPILAVNKLNVGRAGTAASCCLPARQGKVDQTVLALLLQDSPSVKSKYTAAVSVPEGLKALMSANLESERGEADQSRAGSRVFKFQQAVPIPSYLLALAVGNLESRRLGPRSKVPNLPIASGFSLHIRVAKCTDDCTYPLCQAIFKRDPAAS